MTSRRIAELAALLLLFVALLFALPMKAQNPSEQLYLPYVAHVGPYSTALTLTNLTADRVRVSYSFTPVNRSDDDPNAPLTRFVGDVRRLDPHQSMTVEIGDLGISGEGSLYVNACKAGALCYETNDPASPDPANPRILQNFDANAIRGISVTARIYLTNSNGGTRGDSMAAVPWYALPGTDRSMDRVQIVGIRSDGHFTTQVGLANASEYSSTLLTAILRDGTGVEYGRWAEHLGPLMSVKRGIEQMFPLGFVNRLNRRPPIGSPWIEVIQTAVQPNELAARTVGCEDGRAAFEAWASVTDSLSGDFALVTGSFTPQPFPAPLPLSSAIAKSAAIRVTSEVSPPCRVIRLGPYEYRMDEMIAAGVRPQMHFGPPRAADDPRGEMTMAQIIYDELKARTFCGAARTGDAQ